MNPTLNQNTFTYTGESVEPMTVSGTANKTFLLLILLGISATLAWMQPILAGTFILVGGIGGFVVAMVTIFKKEWAATTAPIYAVLEGVVLGAISVLMNIKYPGIVLQAVFLTFATLASLLFAYKTGIVKATQNFKLGVFAATGGIAIFYFISMILSFFKVNVPLIYSASPMGIAFSFFVVVIAALNLVIDFDFIEQGANRGSPKYMEWYGAFALMVTLVWLYIEILNLLSKGRRR